MARDLLGDRQWIGEVMLQDAIEGAAQLVNGIGFEDQIADAELHSALLVFRPDIAGGHDDGNVGPYRQDLAGEVEAG